MKYILFLLLTMAIPTVYATSIKTMTLEEVAANSSNAIVGIVDDITYSKDGRYTYINFREVITVLGQYPHDTYRLRMKGGIKILPDNVIEVLEVEGAPVFNIGEQYMVFISGNGESDVPITGWNQGVYSQNNMPDISGLALKKKPKKLKRFKPNPDESRHTQFAQWRKYQ